MEHFKKIARWHENPIATAAETARYNESQKAIAKLNETIKSLTPKSDEASKTELAKLQ